jgi:hypothetical protein
MYGKANKVWNIIQHNVEFSKTFSGLKWENGGGTVGVIFYFQTERKTDKHTINSCLKQWVTKSTIHMPYDNLQSHAKGACLQDITDLEYNT